jgi:hypothetical protein
MSDHERRYGRSSIWRLGHTTCLRCEADFFTIGFMRRTLEERAAPVGREQWYGTSLSDGGGSGHDLHRMCRSARSENDREANMATCLFDREKVATHASLAPFRERSQTLAWAKPCLAVRTYNACIRSARSEKPKKRTHGRSPNWSRGPTRSRSASHVPRRHPDPVWASPVWRARPTTHYRSTRSKRDRGRRTASACLAARTRHARTHNPCSALPVPRTIPNTRTGEALFGARTYRLTHPLHTFRERSQTLAWRSACLAARTHNARTHNPCSALPVPRTIADPRMGEALFGGPTHDARTNAVLRAEHFAWPPDWDGAS